MVKRVYLKLIDENNKVVKKWIIKAKRSYVIGRNEDANIQIRHFSISRKHVRLSVMGSGSVSVEDLGSANGTFFDKKKLRKNQVMILKKGESLKLAECPCRLKLAKILNKSEFNEEYKDSIDSKNIILAKGSRLEDDSDSEKPKPKIRERSRSRSKDAKKDAKKVNNRQSLTNKWLMESSNMSSEDQKKFMMLMGVRPEELKDKEVDIIQARKLAGRGDNLNQNLEIQFERSRRNLGRGKRGLGIK